MVHKIICWGEVFGVEFSSTSREGISFVQNKIINMHKTIDVDKKVDVVGKDFIIEDDIIISSECTFTNVVFKHNTIYIKNGADVEFSNCYFEAQNDINSIFIYENGNSKIALKKCTFVNYFVAVNAFDNYINVLGDNIFQGCNTAIKVKSLKSIIDNQTVIKENIMISEETSVFLEIEKADIERDNVLKAIRELAVANNFSRIICSVNEKIKFDTYMYCVNDSLELQERLRKIQDGNIIYLRSGRYMGSFSINKSVLVTGDESTEIVPDKTCINGSAILINASNVVLQNIAISSEQDLEFRDGIDFSLEGGKGCVFKNLLIENVRRRGISLWGKRTQDTLIYGCVITGIPEGICISVKGDTVIKECNFRDSCVGIMKKYDEDTVVSKCSVKNVDEFLECTRSSIVTTKIDNNIFLGVKSYLRYI